MKRSQKRSKPRKPQVSTIREAGGKRKGRSMKRPKTTFRNGTVTRDMLDKAPVGAMAHVDKRGKVKMLTYYRERGE